MVITVDPGDTTGIAYWTDKGELIEKEALDFDALLEKLELLEGVSVIVYEDYRLRQGKQLVQTGSRFPAVQVIGALKAYAKRHKAKMVRQDASVLTVAALHSGVKRPSDHSKSHSIDAYNHGYYYFETKGLLQPKPL